MAYGPRDHKHCCCLIAYWIESIRMRVERFQVHNNHVGKLSHLMGVMWCGVVWVAL